MNEHPMRPLRAPRRQRGVSLVEALVSLLATSFGMLAVAGLQSTMRLGADVARQRSEAVRIAQEAIESWRAFSVLDAAASRTAWADVVSIGSTAVDGYSTNTTYQLSRAVAEVGQGLKSLTVTVSWDDRSGQTQRVVLNSALAGIDPSLSGALMLQMDAAAAEVPVRRPLGRDVGIPQQAKDLGNGQSVFKPGRADGTVAWLFDNASGLIVGICNVAATSTTQTLSSADLSGCAGNALAQLLSGSVRFATGESVNAAIAENPSSTALNLDLELSLSSQGHAGEPVCFDDAPTSAAAAATATRVAYQCAIPANSERRWSGRSTIVPRPFSDRTDPTWMLADGMADAYKVCRYTRQRDESTVPNAFHPAQYVDVKDNEALRHQDFLVIASLNACPVDVVPDPARGDFVDSHTSQHQP